MHQLEWEGAALESLAAVCVAHKDRWADINGAVDIIEYAIQQDPLGRSHHVAEGLRRSDLPPIAVYFAVSGSTVTIEAVRWIE